MKLGQILPRNFYNRDTITVARALLGQIITHGETSGRIVEVEAYLGLDDLAAHSSRGLTPRTKPIFGPPGHAYIYLIYGIYECLNIVAEPEGTPGCVLIRALEPVSGLDIMRSRRPAAKRDHDLTSGPGRLTLALGITRAHNATDLTQGPITLHHAPPEPESEIAVSPRIGITQCADWPLRFYLHNNPFVTRTPKTGGPRLTA